MAGSGSWPSWIARVSKSIFGDSSHGMDLHRARAPRSCRRPRRGCSRSAAAAAKLALALAADGYDVVAVDPKAPEGAIFRRTTIEELGDEGPFDAAVASLSLHHVHDLGAALDKVRSLMRPGAPFLVREFAWDLVDEPTARWDYARRGERRRPRGVARRARRPARLRGADATALDERFARAFVRVDAVPVRVQAGRGRTRPRSAA